LQTHVDFLVNAGIHGLVVIGGSGEYVNLALEERKQIVTCALETARDRVPVVVGALSASTREVVEVGLHAAHQGATALLVLPPYYIRPSLNGIVQHYDTIAGETGLPIIAYNNPSRVGQSLDVETLEAIASVPAVVALKDCDRDVAQISNKIRCLGSKINILSG